MKRAARALVLAALGSASCAASPPAASPPVPSPNAPLASSAAPSVAPVAALAPPSSAAQASAAPPTAASGAGDVPPLPPPVFVEVAPASPPAKWPSITLTSPRKGAVVPADQAADIEIASKVTGWLGSEHILYILDNRASLSVDDAGRKIRIKDIDPSPAASAPGPHFVAAVICGPSGESLKPARKQRPPVAVVPFSVGEGKAPAWKEGAPLLLYGGPPPGPAPAEGVLVDFYVLNAELGASTYAVHAAVTGPGLMTGEAIHAWKPWRIRGARPGDYTIRLELFRFARQLGPSASTTTVVYASKPVDGPWTSTTLDFTVPSP